MSDSEACGRNWISGTHCYKLKTWHQMTFISDSWWLTKYIDIGIQITLWKQQWKHQTLQTSNFEHFQSEIKLVSFNMTKNVLSFQFKMLFNVKKIFLAVALNVFLSERHYSGSLPHWIAVYIAQVYEHFFYFHLFSRVLSDCEWHNYSLAVDILLPKRFCPTTFYANDSLW